MLDIVNDAMYYVIPHGGRASQLIYDQQLDILNEWSPNFING